MSEPHPPGGPPVGPTRNTRVVAFVDDTPVAARVVETAATVARATGSDLVVMAIEESDAVDTEIIGVLDDDDILFGVLGGRSLASKPELLGHVAHAVATHSRRSLIVVPPTAKPLTGDHLRFLLPLDGRTLTTDAVAPVVDLLAPIATVIPVHVFDSSTVPMFFTSPEDRAILADDFAARHVGDAAATAVRPRLCIGRPADEILAAIDREEPDAVVVCWGQSLEPGRAEVIRRLLADGRVPIVFHPRPEPPAPQS